MYPRKTFFAAVSLLVLLSLAFGCAKPAPTATPVPPKPTAAPTKPGETPVPPTPVPPTPTPGPKYGGTRYNAQGVAPTDIDPQMIVGGDGRFIHMIVYNRVVRVDRDGVVVPDLAKSWEISADGLVYTFHLFEGVKFQNVDPVNGREFTADDVVYSMNRLLTPKPEFLLAPLFAAVAKTEAADKYTVKMTLKEPWSGFLTQLGGEKPLYIVPHETVEKWGDLKQHAVGTGAYILDTFERNTGYTLHKNPDYFVKGLPYMDKIETRMMPDSASRLAAFLAKDIDSYGASVPEMNQWKDQYPDMVFEAGLDGNGIPVLWLNSKKAPFNDPRVRKAINLVIDRKKLLDTYGFGLGEYVVGPIPPYAKQWALPKAELEKMPGLRYPKDADIAEAKKLLAEAGFPDGKGLEKFKILHNAQHSEQTLLANIVRDRLKQDLGVEFGMTPKDTGAWLSSLIGNDWDMTVLTFDMTIDPDDHFRLYHPQGYGKILWNIDPTTEPELMSLMQQQRTVTTVEARQQIVWQAQRVMLEKNYSIYLVDRKLFTAHWSYLHGLYGYTPANPYEVIMQWLDK